jgi:hypothetical protein
MADLAAAVRHGPEVRAAPRVHHRKVLGLLRPGLVERQQAGVLDPVRNRQRLPIGGRAAHAPGPALLARFGRSLPCPAERDPCSAWPQRDWAGVAWNAPPRHTGSGGNALSDMARVVALYSCRTTIAPRCCSIPRSDLGKVTSRNSSPRHGASRATGGPVGRAGGRHGVRRVPGSGHGGLAVRAASRGFAHRCSRSSVPLTPEMWLSGTNSGRAAAV